MVKIMGNLNRWLTEESIREMLGWNQENIDLLVNGLSKSIATTPNGLRLINLNDLRTYLAKVRNLADHVLEGSVSSRVRKPREKKKTDTPKLTGKEAANKLGCSYKDLVDLIKNHGLPATVQRRGWYIDPKALEEFSAKNPESRKSLEKKKEEAVGPDNNKDQESSGKEENESSVPRAVISNENIIIVDPSEKSGPNDEPKKENTDPPVQKDLQPETTTQDDQNKKEETDKKYTSISIKKTVYGCKIDDILKAVPGLTMGPIMMWVSSKKVETKIGPGARGEERYIEPESLRDVLLSERNIQATFFETKNMHLPDNLHPAPQG